MVALSGDTERILSAVMRVLACRVVGIWYPPPPTSPTLVRVLCDFEDAWGAELTAAISGCRVDTRRPLLCCSRSAQTRHVWAASTREPSCPIVEPRRAAALLSAPALLIA